MSTPKETSPVRVLMTPKERESVHIRMYVLCRRIVDRLAEAPSADLAKLRVQLVTDWGVFEESEDIPLNTPDHMRARLSLGQRKVLFLATLKGVPEDSPHASDAATLAGLGYTTLDGGVYRATDLGKGLLSPEAQRALRRPKDYLSLPEEERWAVDRRLGVLDWDGG